MAHDDELKDGKKVEVRDWVLHGSIIPLPLGPGMLPAVGEFMAGYRLVGVCSVKSSSLSTESTPTAMRVSSDGFSGPSCTMLLTGATLVRGLDCVVARG